MKDFYSYENFVYFHQYIWNARVLTNNKTTFVYVNRTINKKKKNSLSLPMRKTINSKYDFTHNITIDDLMESDINSSIQIYANFVVYKFKQT